MKWNDDWLSVWSLLHLLKVLEVKHMPLNHPPTLHGRVSEFTVRMRGKNELMR